MTGMEHAIEQAAGVMDKNFNPDRHPIMAAMFRDYARSLAEAGYLAPAPVPAHWWRVIGPDGGLWCETSSESEAREKARPGDTLQQLWETPLVSKWVTADRAEGDGHCCKHPKCPGGPLCCCANDRAEGDGSAEE